MYNNARRINFLSKWLSIHLTRIYVSSILMIISHQILLFWRRHFPFSFLWHSYDLHAASYKCNYISIQFKSKFLSHFSFVLLHTTHLTSTTMILQLTFKRLWWIFSCNSKHEKEECAKNDQFRRRDCHCCPHYNSKVRKICAFKNSSFFQLGFHSWKHENLHTYIKRNCYIERFIS